MATLRPSILSYVRIVDPAAACGIEQMAWVGLYATQYIEPRYVTGAQAMIAMTAIGGVAGVIRSRVARHVGGCATLQMEPVGVATTDILQR